MPQRKQQKRQDNHKVPQRNVPAPKQGKKEAEKPVSVDSLKGKDMSNYKQIVNHYDNRNYKQGLKLSLQFLKHQPMVPDVIAFKGLFMQNLTGDGIPIIKSAVKMDPQNYMTEYLLGLGYKESDKINKAITHLETAKKLYANNSKDSNNGICNELIQLYSVNRNYRACLNTLDSIDESVYKQNSTVYYNCLMNSLDEKMIDTEITKELTNPETTNLRREQLAIIAMLSFRTQEMFKKYETHLQSDEMKVLVGMGINKPFVYSMESFKNALTSVIKENPDSFTYQIAMLAVMIYELQHNKQKDQDSKVNNVNFQEFITLFCKSKYSFVINESSPEHSKLHIKYPQIFDHTDIHTRDIPILYEYLKDIPEVVKSWNQKIESFREKEITSTLVYSICINDEKVLLDKINSLKKNISPKGFKILLRMGKNDMYDKIKEAYKQKDVCFYVGMLRQENKIEEAYEIVLNELKSANDYKEELLLIEKLKLEIKLMNSKSEKYADVDPLSVTKDLLSKFGKGNRYLTTLCVHKLLTIRACGKNTDVFMYCIEIFSKFIKGDWLCNLYDMQDYVLLSKFATYLFNRNNNGVDTVLPYNLDKYKDLPIKEQFAFSLYMRLLVVIDQFVSHLVDYYRYILRRNLISDALMLVTSVRNTFRTKSVRVALAEISAILTKKETAKRLIPEDKKEELDKYALSEYKKNWDATGQTSQDVEYEKIRKTHDLLFLKADPEKLLAKVEYLYSEADPVNVNMYVERMLTLSQSLLLDYSDATKAAKLSRSGLMLVQHTTLGKVKSLSANLPKETLDAVKTVLSVIASLLCKKLPANELVKKKLAEFGLLKEEAVCCKVDMKTIEKQLGVKGDELVAFELLVNSLLEEE